MNNSVRGGMTKQLNDSGPETAGHRLTDAEHDADVMTDEHWKILWFMRDFRTRNRMPASMGDIVRFLAEDLAYGARAKARLFELFPHARAIHICKAQSDVE